jgi:imidazolonepropionase-like amidohydrolase
MRNEPQFHSLPSLIINNVYIVDVISRTITKGDINVIDGVITSSPIPKGKHLFLEINGTNLWAIPGLIDAHVHLFEEFDEKKLGKFSYHEPYEIAKQRALRNVSQALEHGITTVRDVGAYDRRNNRLRDFLKPTDSPLKLRIVSSGSHITRMGGHWYERGSIHAPGITLADLVRTEIKSGADCIKIMNDDIIFDLSEMREITEICHTHGIRVACHAFTKDAIQLALDAGVDTIEHGYTFDERSAELFISNPTYLCPTFVAAHDSVFPPTLEIKEVLDHVFPDCSHDEFVDWYQSLVKYIPYAYKTGVKIIAGTDAGTPPTDFGSLWRELRYYIDLGMTHLDALRSATIVAAQALGLEHEIGSLDTGKSGDILLLASNPLENLPNSLQKMTVIISQGYVVKNDT